MWKRIFGKYVIDEVVVIVHGNPKSIYPVTWSVELKELWGQNRPDIDKQIVNWMESFFGSGDGVEVSFSEDVLRQDLASGNKKLVEVSVHTGIRRFLHSLLRKGDPAGFSVKGVILSQNRFMDDNTVMTEEERRRREFGA